MTDSRKKCKQGGNIKLQLEILVIYMREYYENIMRHKT